MVEGECRASILKVETQFEGSVVELIHETSFCGHNMV